MFRRTRTIDAGDAGAANAATSPVATTAAAAAAATAAAVSEDFQMIDRILMDDDLADGGDVAEPVLTGPPGRSSGAPSALVGRVVTVGVHDVVVDDDTDDDDDDGDEAPLSLTPSDVELQDEDASLEHLLAGPAEIPASVFVQTARSLQDHQMDNENSTGSQGSAVDIGQGPHGRGAEQEGLPTSPGTEGDDKEPPAIEWSTPAKKLPYYAVLVAIVAAGYCWVVSTTNGPVTVALDQTSVVDRTAVLLSSDTGLITNTSGVLDEHLDFATGTDNVAAAAMDLNPEECTSSAEMGTFGPVPYDPAKIKVAAASGAEEGPNELAVVTTFESTSLAPSEGSVTARDMENRVYDLNGYDLPVFWTIRYDIWSVPLGWFAFISIVLAAVVVLVAKKPKKSSHPLQRKMHHWQRDLRRNGRPCRTALKLKDYSGISGSYEKLTVDDLRRVLWEGFGYKAPSIASKVVLIGALHIRYEVVLLGMEEPTIRALLKSRGIHASHDLTKSDLIRLALRTGV